MKIVVIFVVALTMLSCYALPEEDEYSWVIPGEFENISDVQKVMQSIKYLPSSGDAQLPDETYEKHSGDCDEQALLMSHILAEKLNKDAYVCIGTYEGFPHGWVRCEGLFYEATLGGKQIENTENYVLQNAYPYDCYLKAAITGGVR